MFTTIIFSLEPLSLMSKNPSARLENLRSSVMIVIFEKKKNLFKNIENNDNTFPKIGKEIKFIENC